MPSIKLSPFQATRNKQKRDCKQTAQCEFRSAGFWTGPHLFYGFLTTSPNAVVESNPSEGHAGGRLDKEDTAGAKYVAHTRWEAIAS